MKRWLIFAGVLALAFSIQAAPKKNPRGLYVLISGQLGPKGGYFKGKPFGTALNHPAMTKDYVDGIRVREAWANLQPVEDGPIDYSQLDAALTAARLAGKSVSVSFSAGIRSPAWVFNGLKFTDGTYAPCSPLPCTNTITSPSVTFTSSDVGRYVYSTDFLQCTKLQNPISPDGHTMAVNAPPTKSATGAGTFWIVPTDGLQHERGLIVQHAIPFASGVGPDGIPGTSDDTGDLGLMPRPWSVYTLTKFKALINDFGSRYDADPSVSYIIFTGLQVTTELYTSQGSAETAALDTLAASDPEAKKLDASQASNASEAWIANAEDLMTTWLTAFPSTAIQVQFAFPYKGSGFTFPDHQNLEDEFEAWTHSSPRIGRIGYMCNALAVDSTTSYTPNSYIIANHGDSSAGWQMVSNATQTVAQSPPCSDGHTTILRIGLCETDETTPPALYDSLIRGANMVGTSSIGSNPAGDSGGCYVEVYEPNFTDTTSSAGDFTTARSRLVAVNSPLSQPSGDVSPTPTPAPQVTPSALKIIFTK